MTVVFCKDKINWNNSFSKEFLQAWQWGEFQEKVGVRSVRIQMKENNIFFWQAQGFEYKALGIMKFVYLPKISFANLNDKQKIGLFEFLSTHGYMFVRVEAVDKIGEIGDWKMMPINNRQPKNTFVLDTVKSEEEIKNQMHSKTRYNIGLAERAGVVVRAEKDIDVFWRLNEETRQRDRFKSHGKEYYKKMLAMDMNHQLTAYLGDAPIASNIYINFGGVFTYLHGASGNQHRNLMAPYLLQWEGIRLAKRLGARVYDFGGVSQLTRDNEQSPVNRKITCFNGFCWEAAHKWTGITRFKVGFGGEPKNYPDAVEVILKPGLYKLFNKLKKIV